uniref:Guanylate cyclase activator 1d n=1 Tax=Dicentrarchus labrax TaxID=13489 RepID=A0A8C4IRI8_DICLA
MGNHGSNLDDILAEDMHHWYNKFMRESPSGLITLFELKAILGLKGMSENANSYVDQVFFTFDMDGVLVLVSLDRNQFQPQWRTN